MNGKLVEMMKNRRYLLLIIFTCINNLVVFGESIEPMIFKQNSDTTIIKVSFNNSKPGDTLTLSYYDGLLNPKPINAFDQAISVEGIVQKNGETIFKFMAPKKNGYISITRKNKDDLSEKDNDFDKIRGNLNIFSIDRILLPLLVEKGDNFNITITRHDLTKKLSSFGNLTYQFSGISSDKYILKNKIDSIYNATMGNGSAFDENLVFNPNNICDIKISKAIELIEENKKSISLDFYNRLKADIFYGEWKKNRNYNIKSFYETWISKQDSVTILKFRKDYNEVMASDHIELPDSILLDSKEYIDYLRRKEYANCSINYGKFDADKIYNAIKNNYQGEIRDKLMVSYFYFLSVDSTLKNYNQLLYNALQLVRTPSFHKQLQKFNNRKTGNIAYNFSLPDTTGKRISLSDFKGKIVFVDFWYTGCGSCVKYYQEELSKVEHFFRDDPNVVFITISIDKSNDFWKRSIDGGLYTSKNITNLYTEGMSNRHPVIDYYNIYSYPQPMIIDRQGRIHRYNDDSLRKSTSLIQELKNAILTIE